MPLEEGVEAFPDDDENHWELGGLTLEIVGDGDNGLDDLGENEGEDHDAAIDGTTPGELRLSSRPIDLVVRVHSSDGVASPTTAAEYRASLHEIRKVMALLPDRTATRLLRWKRAGETAKRIAVRPARGRPMLAPGDEGSLVHDRGDVQLRLEAPDPIVLSDEYELYEFDAGETAVITNDGALCAIHPTAWWLTATNEVILENLDHGEYVRFPATGSLTVSRHREIVAGTNYGICFGPGSTLFPRWPLLRPGKNNIKASAPCTLYWRHTS